MSGFQRRILGAALALASLAGCGSMIPAYERPAPPVPERFPYDGATTAAATAPADLEWETFFTEPQLRELITIALDHNRDLRAAALAIEQARAQFAIRDAERLPAVGAGANVNRGRNGPGDPVTTYSAGLLVSAWEIDFFGRLASLSEAARAQVLATQEARRATQVALVGSVAAAWLNLAADEEGVELARQTLATREESQRLVQLRFDNGASSELDLRQAQSLTESARVALAQAQRQQALDRNALNLLLGQARPPQFRVAVPLSKVSLPELPVGLPSQVLVQRPDIRRAEMELLASNAQIGAARAAFFPRISLTAGVGSASTELTSLFKGGTWAFTAAPQLLQPVFDAGRNQANLRASQVSREIAVAQYERAIQAGFREVADALASRALLAEQLRAQRQVAEAESVRLRLSRMRYDAGVSSNLELLDAQRSAFAAQQAEIQTRLQILLNQVALFRSLGGGWGDAL
ncbi:efflux transporter outer membrane subunit [Ramlibacter sp. AW1]|uniref:Efflux transporter outer membrane subunit n=1 Tax=Ramlibacter aurantiacus TaxID=2801330 RepID=A0A936ZVJ1_9BURK|nr:efflux transporter outer membrane subunit [Ramlibacter aurantiacus]MBL0423386.1 efflux transporter outer membrane subunit [Ramlibacter aurantiacus]